MSRDRMKYTSDDHSEEWMLHAIDNGVHMDDRRARFHWECGYFHGHHRAVNDKLMFRIITIIACISIGIIIGIHLT